MRKRVVIIGGGVAGLSAAHELVERGFDVTVYERRTNFGGKAASTNTADLPGEHGFRFFPGWYRHLPDTLKRIPDKHGERKVHDCLVAADVNLFASYFRDPVKALLRFPRNLTEVKTLAAFPMEFLRLGLTADDAAFFFGKLVEYAAATEKQRAEVYDRQTWWEFMEAESRSVQFRAYLVDGVTRGTVAAKPKQASADTIARVALRTLTDTLRPGSMVDRVLNGPTNEVWITPWVDYLKAQGVDFCADAELDSISFDRQAISSVRLAIGGQALREARARLAVFDDLASWSKQILEGVDANGDNAWREKLRRDVSELDQAVGQNAARFSGEMDARRWKAQELLSAHDSARKAYQEAARRLETSRNTDVEGAYYVFAMPVEQVAFYVNRSQTLRRRAPSLINLIRLSEHVEWMAGIQFYLTEDVKLTPGHVACLDSEWRLTAISQTQFWPDVDMKERGGGGKVKTILSVDISAWDQKGSLLRREAFSCTKPQIAEEVWHQLKRSLNRPDRAPILRDDMLLEYPRGVVATDKLPLASYHLDDDVVDRFDRKKEAFYKKFESVQFSGEAVLARQNEPENEQGQTRALETSLAFGARRQVLAEPLLVNRAGAMNLRPPVSTEIDNLFLAGDYVRTNTNLATMEAANESARAAVNEILERSGSREPRCQIFPFWIPTDAVRLVEQFFRTGSNSGLAMPARVVTDVATQAGNFARNALGRFLDKRK